MSFITFENKDFDLNSLFNFSSSYEILKQVISTIVSSNKQMSYKINDLNDEMSFKDNQIKDLLYDLNLEKQNTKRFIQESDNNFKELTLNMVKMSKAFNDLSIVVQDKLELEKPLEILNEEKIISSISNIQNSLNNNLQSIEEKAKEEINNRNNETNKKRDTILKQRNDERKTIEKEENKRLENKKNINNNNNINTNNFNINSNNSQIRENNALNRLRDDKSNSKFTDDKKNNYNNDINNSKKNSLIYHNNNSLNSNNINDFNELNNNNNINNNINNNSASQDYLSNNNNYNNNSSYNNNNNISNTERNNISNNMNNNNNNNFNPINNRDSGLSLNDYNTNSNFNNNNNYNNNNNNRNSYNQSNNNINSNNVSNNKLANQIIKLEDILNIMNKRIVKLEQHTEDTNKFQQEHLDNTSTVTNLKKNPSLKLIDLQNQNNNTSTFLEELKMRVMNLEMKTTSFDEKIEDLIIKSQDLDIYDALKSGGDNTNLDQALILVQSLEKKIFKKFEFTDDKLRKLEEDQNKVRNDNSRTMKKVDLFNTELVNSNSTIEKIFRDIEKTNQLISVSANQGEDSNNKNLIQLFTDLEKKIDDKLAKISFNLGDLFTDKQNIDHMRAIVLKTLEEKIPDNTIAMIESDLNKVKLDLSKKATELDKQIKILANTINIEKVNIEIAKLNDSLQRKINLEDFSELKSNTNLISHQVTYLKETLSQVVDDRKVLEDIAWLRKKVENLTNSMLSFRSADDIVSSNSKGGINFDSSKYLEGSVFNAFHKNYVKDMEFLKNLTDDNKGFMDELNDKLKLRVSDSDMKNLEEYLVNRMEEMRIMLSKKFADKLDTQKNIKYVEAQIKHVIDVYVKKMEKGDNWMLAKKPVNGYTCASCENYLGDLNDKANEFTAWNKYPARETNDKAYKMGNGFSRMLQMLNVDLKNTHYREDFSDIEDFRRSQRTNKLMLPEIGREKQIKNSKEKNNDGNTSMDNALLGDDNLIKSKIVRIVKKNK